MSASETALINEELESLKAEVARLRVVEKERDAARAVLRDVEQHEGHTRICALARALGKDGQDG